MKADWGQREDFIRGIVIPAQWDERGNVVSIAISTAQEEEFLIIEDSGKARELRRHIHEEVEVWAVVTEDAVGNKQVRVKDYRKADIVGRSMGG